MNLGQRLRPSSLGPWASGEPCSRPHGHHADSEGPEASTPPQHPSGEALLLSEAGPVAASETGPAFLLLSR